MKIDNQTVASIHYTLTLPTGELVDTTEGDEPLRFLVGAKQIIPGLEDALMGKEKGEELDVVVEPENGYGEVDETLVQQLPRDMFTGIDNIEVGMEFQTQGQDGQAHYVIVVDVTDDEITVDGNPEFAGKTLHFKVKIDDVREATEEEMAHGHAHWVYPL